MALGSVIFVLIMLFCSSWYSPRADRDDPDRESMSPFAAGFVAAAILGVAWIIFGERQNPHWRGKLRAETWDDSPEAPIRPQVWIDGHESAWVACVRYSRTSKMANVELAAHFPEDDLYFDEDVHVLPFTNDDPWHGAHTFARSCPCHPEIMEQHHERTLVMHKKAMHL